MVEQFSSVLKVLASVPSMGEKKKKVYTEDQTKGWEKAGLDSMYKCPVAALP